MESPEQQDLGPATTVPQWFATTHWSVVMLAAAPDSSRAFGALEKLCRTYWLPLYSYVRRRGFNPHDAQDLTQGFFVRLLTMNSFSGVRREKGKFRTFLLAALNHFLSDELDRARAQKRGGGQAIISIDENEAEDRYLQGVSLEPEPEKAFDRRWGLTVLEEALARLRQEYLASNRSETFEYLRLYLSKEVSPGDYDSIAPRLGMTPNAVGVAVHRMRQRYRECIRLELAQTVASPQDLDEEMNYLFSVLSL
jgi:RNA polymerase sigma factor (sigma-70 family)